MSLAARMDAVYPRSNPPLAGSSKANQPSSAIEAPRSYPYHTNDARPVGVTSSSGALQTRPPYPVSSSRADIVSNKDGDNLSSSAPKTEALNRYSALLSRQLPRGAPVPAEAVTSTSHTSILGKRTDRDAPDEALPMYRAQGQAYRPHIRVEDDAMRPPSMIPEPIDVHASSSFQYFPPDAPSTGSISRDSHAAIANTSATYSTARGFFVNTKEASARPLATSVSHASLQLLEAVEAVDAADILDAVADQDW